VVSSTSRPYITPGKDPVPILSIQFLGYINYKEIIFQGYTGCKFFFLGRLVAAITNNMQNIDAFEAVVSKEI